jgi:hypothetical protein
MIRRRIDEADEGKSQAQKQRSHATSNASNLRVKSSWKNRSRKYKWILKSESRLVTNICDPEVNLSL